MRVSQQLTTTLREVPRDSEGGNQELLVRAGFIRQLTSGVYSLLPPGTRVIHKISQIVREEMDRAGGQEVIMPVLQPKDLWDIPPAGGGPTRSEVFGDVLFKLKDRKGRDMVLGPTHEEVVTTLVSEFVRSVLAREPVGELDEIYTPNCTSISDLAAFLHIPEAKTIKSVCYVAGGRFVLAIVRGDLDINEVKLANTLYLNGVNAADLHLATPEELEKAGIVAGYTSPLHKGAHVLIVADPSLHLGNNFVAGANKANYHLKNVNEPRDFRVDIWEDIASAFDGATCVRCGGTLHAVRGSELGHIFKLGARYSEALGAAFLDAEGVAQPILMGCYGIGIGRIMAALVEQSHDERGIIWPFSIAPYHVALIGLDLDKGETGATAEQLYADLSAAGVEVLFDDRAETAGVKFNDADLLGLPLRAVVSKRSLKNGGIELKLRSQKESRIVPMSDAVRVIQEEIRRGI